MILLIVICLIGFGIEPFFAFLGLLASVAFGVAANSDKKECDLIDNLPKYSEALGPRTATQVSHLARSVYGGGSAYYADKAIKDLNLAIKRGYIPEGHLVGKGPDAILFVTDQAYYDATNAQS